MIYEVVSSNVFFKWMQQLGTLYIGSWHLVVADPCNASRLIVEASTSCQIGKNRIKKYWAKIRLTELKYWEIL
jgi:hypothetical protein